MVSLLEIELNNSLPCKALKIFLVYRNDPSRESTNSDKSDSFLGYFITGYSIVAIVRQSKLVFDKYNQLCYHARDGSSFTYCLFSFAYCSLDVSYWFL